MIMRHVLIMLLTPLALSGCQVVSLAAKAGKAASAASKAGKAVKAISVASKAGKAAKVGSAASAAHASKAARAVNAPHATHATHALALGAAHEAPRGAQIGVKAESAVHRVGDGLDALSLAADVSELFEGDSPAKAPSPATTSAHQQRREPHLRIMGLAKPARQRRIGEGAVQPAALKPPVEGGIERR